VLVLSSMVTVLKLERERGCKVKLALGFGKAWFVYYTGCHLPDLPFA